MVHRVVKICLLAVTVAFLEPAGFCQQVSGGTDAGPGATVLAPPPPVVDGSYKISPQDVIKISVFQEDDLTTTARVGEDGTVQMPLIGSVRVGGRSIREATALIEAGLRKDYLVSPQVAVGVSEFAKRRFAILGQVQRPGTYEVPANERLDVLQAIGLAGGYTRSANAARIVVKRVSEGSERIFRLNAKEMARDGSSRGFPVMPGDTITVEESFF
jgi:polysaccharide export outer membrane protein